MERSHRQICFEEKDRECTVCRNTSDVLVHHADGDSTNDAIENLIPLCPSCHQKVHNKRRDSEKLVELINRLERGSVGLDPREFDDVPNNATVTTKETQPGLKYYYWQWRDGGSIKSKYIGPVDDYDFTVDPIGHEQASLEDWSGA